MDLFFPALFDRPPGLGFVDQETDEKIELFLRQHPITLVPYIIITLILIIAPALALQLDLALSFNLITRVPTTLLAEALILYYLIVIAYVLEQFLLWYFNVYIVSTLHLLDVKFYNLINREVIEIDLKDIEGVSSKITGVIGSLFNYGDVIVQSAGNTKLISFLRVPQPDFVADRIEDLEPK